MNARCWRVAAAVLFVCMSVGAADPGVTNSVAPGAIPLRPANGDGVQGDAVSDRRTAEQSPPDIPADAFAKFAARTVRTAQATTAPPLAIVGLTPSSRDTQLHVRGTPGWTYEVQSTSDLSSTNWERLGSATIGGPGSAVVTDSRDRPSQFYRITQGAAARGVASVVSMLLLDTGL